MSDQEIEVCDFFEQLERAGVLWVVIMPFVLFAVSLHCVALSGTLRLWSHEVQQLCTQLFEQLKQAGLPVQLAESLGGGSGPQLTARVRNISAVGGQRQQEGLGLHLPDRQCSAAISVSSSSQ